MLRLQLEGALGRGIAMIRVVAGVVVDSGRVLVARRRAALRLGGLWEFPGGKVEPGEDDTTALARELLEELNIVVTVHDCLGENEHEGDRGRFCLVAYRCTLEEGTLELRDHDEVRWMAPADLHSLTWAPADVPLIAAAIASASCT